MSTERLFTLIDLVYAAPGTMEGWQAFLNRLQREVHGSSANLICRDSVSHRGGMVATTGDADGMRLYDEHWVAHDPWARSPALARVSQPSVHVGEALIRHTDFTRTAFYADFARHYDLVRNVVGVLEPAPGMVSVTTVTRSERGEPFGSHDVKLLNRLLPHLRRALQLHRRLVDSQTLVDASTAALDRLAQGVVLIDTSGCVLMSNRTAQEIASTRDGLSLRNRELLASRTQDTKALHGLISNAIATSRGLGTESGGMVTIERPSGRAAYRVLIAPIGQGRIREVSATAAAWVFITDPERFPIPPAEHIQRIFGLTPAETRVAMAMLNGENLALIADRLCISRNTARTHLQRLFAKTGASRQADLIRVLLGVNPSLRFD